MANRSTLRTAARAELSDTAALWTDVHLNRAVDEVTADFSRLIPLDKIHELTIDYLVTAEAWTTNHGTAVTLANKPITFNTETVKIGTTVHVRDTDYTIDYVNGTITSLSSGSMADSTAATIGYSKSRIAFDLSSLTDLLVPIRVEAPAGKVPMDDASFYMWNDILWITSWGSGRTQAQLGDKEHIRIYYHAQHTAPTDSADGTFPRFLDEVMVKGMVAYALFMKGREQALQAITDQASVRTQLGNIATVLTAAEVAMDALSTPYTSISAALDDTDTTVADINAALDKVEVHAATAVTALAKVATHSGVQAVSALDDIRPSGGDISLAATANGGRSVNLTSASHGLETGDVVDILGTTSYNGRFVVVKVDDNIFQIQDTFVADEQGNWVKETPIGDAAIALDKVATEAALANTALGKVDTYLASATESAAEAIGLVGPGESVDLHALAKTALDLIATYMDLVHKADASSGDLLKAENTWSGDDPGVEDFLVEDVGNSAHVDFGAQEYLQTGDGLIDEVNKGVRVPEINREYALASIEIAKQYAERRKDFLAEADRHTGQAQTYILEANARMLQVEHRLTEAGRWAEVALGFVNEAIQRNQTSAEWINEAAQRVGVGNLLLGEAAQRNTISLRFIEEAQAEVALSQAFVAEASQRVQEVRMRYEEAQGWVAKGNLYLAEAGRRFDETDAYVLEAQTYATLATQVTATADRFFDDARERHRDYWDLLKSRVQTAQQRSMSTTRQYAQAGMEGPDVPRGPSG